MKPLTHEDGWMGRISRRGEQVEEEEITGVLLVTFVRELLFFTVHIK